MNDRQHDSPSNDDALEQADRLRLATARLARRLRQEAGTGLSPSQSSALMSIDKHGPLTLGQLARIEQIAPPTTTRIVARLEDDGLVHREARADDRRSVLVDTTAEGRRRLDHGRRRRNAWLAQRLAGLDPARHADLSPALRLLEALAADPEPEPPADADADAGEPPEPVAGDGGGDR